MSDKDLECFGMIALNNDIFLDYLWKGHTCALTYRIKWLKEKNIEKDDRYLLSSVNFYNSLLLKITYPLNLINVLITLLLTPLPFTCKFYTHCRICENRITTQSITVHFTDWFYIVSSISHHISISHIFNKYSREF